MNRPVSLDHQTLRRASMLVALGLFVASIARSAIVDLPFLREGVATRQFITWAGACRT